jgi:GNAT superfamily N-acetyltransferase
VEDIKVRIQLLDDLEDARELYDEFQIYHSRKDAWPGDEHTYWGLYEGKHAVGLTSAVFRPEKGYVYFSYAIIIPGHESKGLQRRLINHRLRWAKKQGAIYAVTYTLLKNYPSMINLLRCGFRLTDEPRGWLGHGDGVHYFEKQLT